MYFVLGKPRWALYCYIGECVARFFQALFVQKKINEGMHGMCYLKGLFSKN